MAFYGSLFSNDTPTANRRVEYHARHIACPQRLKYIHDVKDGYIPYVEDSKYSRLAVPTKFHRFGLHNRIDAWREELMGLAQQVQTSFDESRSARLTQRSRKRTDNFMSNSFANDQRLLTGRISNLNKPKLSIDENSTNKTQDAGIWLLPMLCYVLHVDNIHDAQEWLLNANPTEKRLAMELISRTMQDMQNREEDFASDSVVLDQTSSLSINNVYWPYKFWQHQNHQQQQQLKSTIDANDTCERATSPVRFVTPAQRPATTSNRSSIETRSLPSSRLITPNLPSPTPVPSARRTHRVATCTSSNADLDAKLLRGRTPLI